MSELVSHFGCVSLLCPYAKTKGLVAVIWLQKCVIIQDRARKRGYNNGVMRLLNLLKSKIHRATVTQADKEYIGSIVIPHDLIERVGLVENELVHVWNISTGTRFETYVLPPSEPGSGEIIVNGAAAHLVTPGDKIIIAAFCLTDEPITPKMILVDDENRYVKDL